MLSEFSRAPEAGRNGRHGLEEPGLGHVVHDWDFGRYCDAQRSLFAHFREQVSVLGLARPGLVERVEPVEPVDQRLFEHLDEDRPPQGSHSSPR